MRWITLLVLLACNGAATFADGGRGPGGPWTPTLDSPTVGYWSRSATCAPGDLGGPGPYGPEDCHDGVDDNGDGWVDCCDERCSRDSTCREDCVGGEDEDGDRLVDCEDIDCEQLCDEHCTNQVDDDSDGLRDCADDECARHPACQEVCDNTLDDDADGLVDCEDPSCELACDEDCGNGQDDDADGWIDCADWGECGDARRCQEV
jgi:hypothetical protein